MGQSVSRRAKISEFEAEIIDLSHDGRGVARHEGKAVFVVGALVGERVRARISHRSRSYDEAELVEVLSPSPLRVTPRCRHFDSCSGCVLQHLDAGAQIAAKQRVLLDNLERIGRVSPARVLAPLTAEHWGYRRKGRLSVRWVEKKGRTVVGFRERNPRFVADLSRCETTIPAIGERIAEIAALVDRLDIRRDIPQIEFIAGDCAVVLVFRVLQAPTASDRANLREFAERTGLAVFLQPGGVESVSPLWPEQLELFYTLPEFSVRIDFRPLDFIQVNEGINRAMIARTLAMLAPEPGERVLDLFCGLGNFSLPIARSGAEVVGVEGEAGLVARARENARSNGLPAVVFHAADLASDLGGEPWLRQGFDRVLLDPPRSGAEAVLAQLPLDGVRRIVYVSCHPGSLARDAGFLVRERGFTLVEAGVMDMFPHTAHVESIACFER